MLPHLSRPPDVSIVIVGYRTRDELRRCLCSLEQACDGVLAEVIVIDNASGDGTASMVRSDFPAARVVELELNVGFGRAVNLGAQLAHGQYLLLLNPDTVAQPRSVAALVDFARQRPRAGLVGGRTLRADGSTEPSSCWGAPSFWSTMCFALGLSTAFEKSPWFNPEAMPGWDRRSVREVGVVTGCLLLVERALWTKLGGFDPRFFMYGEDTDLSLRARAAGLHPMITPAAEVIHTIGASSTDSSDRRGMIMQGKVTLLRKHWREPMATLGVAMLLGGVALRAALGWITSVGRRGESPERQSWRGAWRRRSEWVMGYPPFDAASAVPLTIRVDSMPGRDPGRSAQH